MQVGTTCSGGQALYSLLALQICEVNLFGKKLVVLLAAEARKQIGGTTTVGNNLKLCRN